MTLTVGDILSNSLSLNFKLERPVLLSISKDRYRQIGKILAQFGQLEHNSEPETILNKPDSNSTEKMFVKDIKVKTSQIMCSYDCKVKDASCSVKMSFGASNAAVEFEDDKGRVHLNLSVELERLAAFLAMNDTKHSLFDPFNLEVKIRKPLYSRSALSHSFVAIKVNQRYLHLGPNHIFILESIKNNLKEMIGETTLTSYENEVSFDEVDTTTDCEVEKQEDSEQYYQDDLRAGAFQFLDYVVNGAVFDPAPYQAVFNKTTLTWRYPQSRALSKVVIFPLPFMEDDLRAGAFQFLDSVVNGAVFDPAPYQAVFNKTTLTWRYPQSRALSKVVIFPLPFMEASEFSFDNNETVDCELLFWSEALQSFIVYQTFQLSESSVIHLDLPIIRDRKACSSSHTWQVRLNKLGDQVYITPQSLISVMKIDSFPHRNCYQNLRYQHQYHH